MNVTVTPLTNVQKRDRQGVVARLVTTLWRKLGVALREIARLLDLAESTVRSWIGRDHDVVGVPGRPRGRAGLATRNDIMEAQRAASGRLSVRELKRAYPHVTRRPRHRPTTVRARPA